MTSDLRDGPPRLAKIAGGTVGLIIFLILLFSSYGFTLHDLIHQ